MKGFGTVTIEIHMTNVNLVPVLAWGSITLDFEWRMTGGLQFEDQQTRDRVGCDDALRG